MATTTEGYLYGDAVGDGHWRAAYWWKKVVDDTTVTCTVECGMQSIEWGIKVDHVDVSATLNGQTNSASDQSFSSSTSETKTTWYPSTTTTVTVSRNKDDYTIPASAKVYNHSGYLNGTSTVSDTFFIPAREYAAHGAPSLSASKTTTHYGESIKLSWAKSSTQGNANFDHFELWQGSNKLYSGSNTSYTVTPSDVTGAKGGTAIYMVKEIHEWYGTYPSTEAYVTITVRSGVVTVYDEKGTKHVGLVSAYDEKGEHHYVLITAYDENGKFHNVV